VGSLFVCLFTNGGTCLQFATPTNTPIPTGFATNTPEQVTVITPQPPTQVPITTFWPADIQANAPIPAFTPAFTQSYPCSGGGLISERVGCALQAVNTVRQTNPGLTWAQFIGMTLSGEGGTILQGAEGPCFTRNRSEVVSGSEFHEDPGCTKLASDFIYAVVEQLYAKCSGKTPSGNGLQGAAVKPDQCTELGFAAFLDDINAWYDPGNYSNLGNPNTYATQATNELMAFKSYTGDRGYGQCPCKWGNVPLNGFTFDAAKPCTYSYAIQDGSNGYDHFVVFGGSCK